MDFLESYQTQFEILAYVALAMFLGALIGFERELKDKPAGLRTHMLVAGSSALLIGLGDVVILHFAEDLDIDLVRSDPLRLMQAVVTGISFLGAGTILHRKSASEVEGLTTSASILFSSVVGIGVALRQVVLGVGATILVLLTLRGLGYLERKMGQK